MTPIHVVVLEAEEVTRGYSPVSAWANAGDPSVRLPDLVLMDVRAGARDGAEACRILKEWSPSLRVLILTSDAGDDTVLAALTAGAAGFLVRTAPHEELLHAIRCVASGDSLLDPSVTGPVTRRLVELTLSGEHPLLRLLSPREHEVLALLAEGRTNREIASHLVISDTTARNHVSHILEKLGVRRRAEAAVIASQLGFGTSINQ